MTEHKVLDAIQNFRRKGCIRAFGPVFEARKLGYVSTLSAAQVDPDHLPTIASGMFDIPEITHNYLRDHAWNVWFTITAADRDSVDRILDRVRQFPGVKEVMDLPATRVFKISAVWGVHANFHAMLPDGETDVSRFGESEKTLVRALQQDFPIVEQPFRQIAEKIGGEHEAVLDTIREWNGNGTIRRFGARLNHRKLGYVQNLLTVWGGKRVEEWGKAFAGMDQVSHCYLREPRSDWPYSLYAMVHTRSEEELNRSLSAMKRRAPGAAMIRLRTVSELKKTVMSYFLEEKRT